MFLGLPWTAWLLILSATLPGLGLAIAFRLAHRAPRAPRSHP